MTPQELADYLTAKFPWRKFSFGVAQGTDDWAFRYLISCILVGGSLETNTLECARQIFEKHPSPYDLSRANFREIADIIEQSGVRFAGTKAKNIINTARTVRTQYNGRVPDTRAKLEELPGVGRHVASVILATVYDQNEFAVDVHVKRIANRFGILGDEWAIEHFIVNNVKPEMLGHFSRSFVDFGQTQCSYTPNCSTCELYSRCPSKNEKVKRVEKTFTPKPLDGYFIEVLSNTTDQLKLKFTKPGSPSSCFVTKTAHKISCTCKGFLFRKRCKHAVYAKTLDNA